jgi:DNA-binding transcriptional LysR family regulator
VELRHLRYFVAVAETLHFGRAAERLGISQPPLSQQIQALEAELDARLFERTNRRVELTEAGRLFLVEARQILAQVDRAADTARRAQLGELGVLKIGFTASAPFTSTLPRSILAFRQAFPAVQLDLHENNSRGVVDALLRQTVHVGLIRPLGLPDSLHAEALFDEPLIAALHSDHPLADEAGPLSLAQLSGEPFVYFPRTFGSGLYDQLMALAAQAGFTPHMAQEAGEPLTIIGLVAAGLGVSVLPASYRRFAIENVAYRELADAGASSSVWLVRRQEERSPLVRAFAELLVREARQPEKR